MAEFGRESRVIGGKGANSLPVVALDKGLVTRIEVDGIEKPCPPYCFISGR